jgi:large subunit ribosomal protein L4
LRTALSTKYAQDDLIVVNSINLPSPKTQELLSLFSHHSWDPLADDKLLGNSLLFLSETDDKNLSLAMRNLKRVHGLTAQEIFEEADVYNIIGHEKVVIELAAVRRLEELLREPSVVPRNFDISIVEDGEELDNSLVNV